MPPSLLASLALIAGLAASALPSTRPKVMKEPFRFNLAPHRQIPSGQELWDATVKPDGVPDSLPPAFQLRIAPPGRGAPPGTVLKALVSRGDRRGMTYMLVMLGEAFGPMPNTQSGQLMAFAIEPSDSIRLVLTVTRQDRRGSWRALAQLPNGGRFEIAIDSATSRGEFRSVNAKEDDKVFLGLAALTAPRP